MSLLKNYKLLWSIIIVLILIPVWLYYNVIKLSCNLHDEKYFHETTTKQRDFLVTVFNEVEKDANENKILDIFSDTSKYHVSRKDKEHLAVNNVIFFFKDEKFIRVSVSNQEFINFVLQ